MGNWEHLALIEDVLATPVKSEERRQALARWSELNTSRTDSVMTGDRSKKGPFTLTHAGIDLTGASFDGRRVGPIDLRGAHLAGSSWRGAVLPKALFNNADLTGCDLTKAFLRGADLAGAHLEGANLTDAILGDANLRDATFDKESKLERADLQGANLSKAKLIGTCLQGANLQLSQMMGTELNGADLRECLVFGAAAWNLVVDKATQQTGLIVTPRERPKHINPRKGSTGRGTLEVPSGIFDLRADSLEHSYVVHLMSNPNLHGLLSSMTKLGVLLIGRFTGSSGAVLEALRIPLQRRGFIPLKFAFDPPDGRTLKETLLTLAGLSKFVIADLTDAKSVALEIGTIVKEYRIPVVAIRREGDPPFSLFESIEREFPDRVLRTLEYKTSEDLSAVFDSAVIDEAVVVADRLEQEKRMSRASRKTSDYPGSGA
jgi:uncharacterized protein YjbI with pentapeptide repeats